MAANRYRVQVQRAAEKACTTHTFRAQTISPFACKSTEEHMNLCSVPNMLPQSVRTMCSTTWPREMLRPNTYMHAACLPLCCEFVMHAHRVLRCKLGPDMMYTTKNLLHST